MLQTQTSYLGITILNHKNIRLNPTDLKIILTENKTLNQSGGAEYDEFKASNC